MSAALSIMNLAKSYGSIDAVKGVSFEVATGEIFGLLGPNGAGKTTTLECVIGLRRLDGGSVHVGSIDALANPGEARRIMGVQLQSTALQQKITPREALRLFASFYERPADIESLIKQFDLTQKADALFETLSGGQKQRLALALALVNLPQLVFLDEPTAGLDPKARRELHKTIRELKTAGRTIVLTTHYIEEAMQLCDRVAIMHQGRIVAIGTPSELLARSKTPPHLLFTTRVPLATERISALDAVISVTLDGQGWRVATTSLTQTMLALIRMTESEKNELLDLQIHRPTLEDVFLELTGTPLESRTEA